MQNEYWGIWLDNVDCNEIENNDIMQNGDSGISVNGSKNNNIENNDIMQNGGSGISISRSKNNNISNNKIHYNEKTGLSASTPSPGLEPWLYNIISDNDINHNGEEGIYLAGSMNTVEGNTVTYNRDIGIAVGLTHKGFGYQYLDSESRNNILNNNYAKNNGLEWQSEDLKSKRRYATQGTSGIDERYNIADLSGGNWWDGVPKRVLDLETGEYV